jgi:hypothetical protein
MERLACVDLTIPEALCIHWQPMVSAARLAVDPTVTLAFWLFPLDADGPCQFWTLSLTGFSLMVAPGRLPHIERRLATWNGKLPARF